MREVHVWSDRAGRLWKQGIGRPTDTPPVPATLDWNLWLGPIRERPYSPAYAPVSWRGWWDFGTGAMGDMGCHIIDHPVWALRLGPPSVVEARTTIDGSFLDGDKPNTETYPDRRDHLLRVPARGDLPPVQMTWYDGGLMPPAPAELPPGERFPDNGVLYVGSKGKMYHGSHGGMPSFCPAALHEEAAKVTKSMRRSPGHYEEWVAACKGGPASGLELRLRRPAHRDHAAGRPGAQGPGRRLEWDSENRRSIANAAGNSMTSGCTRELPQGLGIVRGRGRQARLPSGFDPIVTSIRASSCGVRSIETASPSMDRSTMVSPRKSAWRAHDGLRNSRSRHRHERPAVSSKWKARPQPRPSLVSLTNSTCETATPLWSTCASQPAGADRRRTVLNRHDQGRRDEVERRVERVLQIEHDAERERPRRLQAGDQQGVEHPAAVLAVIGQTAEEQGRPLSSRRDVDRIGRLGPFGLGQLGRPENTCGAASSSGRATPSGTPGRPTMDRPGPPAPAMPGRGRPA